MDKREDKKLSRRKFMRLAAITGGSLSLTGGGYAGYRHIRSNKFEDIHTPLLNPAFRIKEISEQKIELFTHLPNGELLKFTFDKLEADLFREIEKEKEIVPIINELSIKYNLSQGNCKKILQKYLKEFEEAKLIYYGKKMKVKYVEIINE